MIDYKEMIHRLEAENQLIDLPESQREANKWRMKLLELYHREKVEHTSTIFLDPIAERLTSPSYRCTPAKLLSTD